MKRGSGHEFWVGIQFYLPSATISRKRFDKRLFFSIYWICIQRQVNFLSTRNLLCYNTLNLNDEFGNYGKTLLASGALLFCY